MEANCRSKRMLAIKRCKHFELGGDKKRKVSVAITLANELQDLSSLLLFYMSCCLVLNLSTAPKVKSLYDSFDSF